MKSVLDTLEQRISAAMAAATGRKDCAAIVRPATDARFGDYQVNGVMALAKQVKTNPRKLAEEVVKNLDLRDICEPPDVAGPGFINLRLKAEFAAGELLEINKDPAGIGIKETTEPKTIVVDFSSPNIAKQMHVGHLRSTIIGDCICRMLECLGHKVIRQNHIGDWGTQFGKVIIALWHICMAEKVHRKLYYKEDLDELRANRDNPQQHEICLKIRDRHNDDYNNDQESDFGDGKKYFGPFLDELEYIIDEIWPDILTAYQFVNLLDDILSIQPNKEVLTLSREKENDKWVPKEIPYYTLTRKTTVMLQKGGEDNRQERKAWRIVRRKTLEQCEEIYDLLKIKLTRKDVRGEASYRRFLPKVVDELLNNKIAEYSNGAVCVFPEGFNNKEGQPLPFIIQKSDGAYLYPTTDLAALQFRVNKLNAQRIVYVAGSPQKQHFEMLFAVARMAGWDKKQKTEYRIQETEFVHVPFGSVLGDDGIPLKTRSGENVKLKELLDEAVERAMAVVEEKNPDLSAEQKAEIARAVGIGAVKYADYSNNRTSDYVFSFDKMLAMEGNTAPYMQYAYARIKSIERKAQSKDVDVEAELESVKTLSLTEPAELDLAKHLIRYGEAIEGTAADYRPNYLTAYLYELSQKFSAFYTNCPVLGAGPDKRPTRLLLCDLTAKTIRHGLRELLGIEVVEQM
jgi:arginyl-tRNA synthetase